MTPDEIRTHWQNWADTYGTGLRATTKTGTAKELECSALKRAIESILVTSPVKDVLEVGCGNGYNCFYVSEQFPKFTVTGVDYIPKMVESARELKKQKGIVDDKVSFLEGDILKLQLPKDQYDLIFTTRCLINLNTDELQAKAIASLAQHLPKGGHLILMENSRLTHGKQNFARGLLDLPPRKAAEFNHFIDEEVLKQALTQNHLELLKTDDFLSLHDLVLYVLVPAINGGEIDYQHPLVQAATRLNIEMASTYPGSFGDYGQIRLFLCRKI